VVSVLVVAASGYLLAGVVAARVSAGPRLWPRHWFRDALDRHAWDSAPALAIASAAALLGLVTLVLALSPGRRGLRPVRPTWSAESAARVEAEPARVEAELEAAPIGVFAARRALAGLLAQQARSMSEVSAASARLRGRTLRVRAEQRFGTGPDVAADLERSLRERLDTLSLDRPPRLRLRLIPGPGVRS
jgi:hypothetical protein